MDNLMSHRNPKAIIGAGHHRRDDQPVLLNDKDYLATRVSHQFNLRGPSLIGADRLLVVAGRGAPGVPEPAVR